MHQEMARCYPSLYAQPQEEVQEEVQVPNTGATENPEEVAGTTRENVTQTTTTDMETARIMMMLVEKTHVITTSRGDTARLQLRWF